jgi:hypothetical protein
LLEKFKRVLAFNVKRRVRIKTRLNALLQALRRVATLSELGGNTNNDNNGARTDPARKGDNNLAATMMVLKAAALPSWPRCHRWQNRQKYSIAIVVVILVVGSIVPYAHSRQRQWDEAVWAVLKRGLRKCSRLQSRLAWSWGARP